MTRRHGAAEEEGGGGRRRRKAAEEAAERRPWFRSRGDGGCENQRGSKRTRSETTKCSECSRQCISLDGHPLWRLCGGWMQGLGGAPSTAHVNTAFPLELGDDPHTVGKLS